MIEDDLELAQIITDYLRSFDIDVTTTDSPYNGLSMLDLNKDYELLILDLTLPEIDGLELIPKIREKSNIPIIISSARDDILDKVMGLERGADDYLPKPYNPRELQARIKTILKRVDSKSNSNKNQEDQIFELRESDLQIIFKNVALNLTLAEYDILKLLIQRNHGVVSREDFIYTSDNIEDDSSLKNIDVIISRIRTKLSNIDDSRQYIRSVRGIGYQLI
ncbi:response regulator transcription factor [Aliarcobacter cibarius]|jgi:two-component system, OmpR family, response regulator|uniref:Response regulator transcription factor n=2 Tax=Aliarcobacter cibarius TaxID=255507 RepID=A0A5J6RDY2_9BACT|nr:response regulator transcription factor [Aliarcobacter cibarius]QEZ88349.1 two-component system response regulator [Aliarcobacter cibarius]QKJ26380.1 two-component system response regulator [Aliarcobacter cibarius]TLT01868.1 response regulator transcription factor [Aliarcobacter cibarius]TLT02203.1 response regulator transcription factor [Aliarcobacter cibarius]TLT04634.1 response regulator transcription factor [Aliarcobacter cibarius]